MPKPTYDKPSEVTTDRGRVQLDGPDHVDVALTPEAAEETARRLGTAAKRATDERDDLGDIAG